MFRTTKNFCFYQTQGTFNLFINLLFFLYWNFISTILSFSVNSVSNKSLLKINTMKWFWFTEHHFFKFLANTICTVHTVKMSALLYEKEKEAIIHQQFFKHHIENFVDNEICRFVLLSASTCMPKTISFFNSCMITDASILRTLLQTLKTWFSKWNSECVLPFEGN